MALNYDIQNIKVFIVYYGFSSKIKRDKARCTNIDAAGTSRIYFLRGYF